MTPCTVQNLTQLNKLADNIVNACGSDFNSVANLSLRIAAGKPNFLFLHIQVHGWESCDFTVQKVLWDMKGKSNGTLDDAKHSCGFWSTLVPIRYYLDDNNNHFRASLLLLLQEN